jgi:plasmid replication initiation protein
MSDKSLIYKDNRIVEASYRLTLREQRLVLLCISQINALESLSENKIFTITAAQYSQAFGGDIKHSFRDITGAIDSLFERSIKVTVNEDKIEIFRWISKKSTVLSNQSVEVRFTPDIAPYLSNLKGNFTKYHFLNISGMASVFSIRLYEMLIRWKTKKVIVTGIDDLKEKLQISDKYPAFANLKQKVIDVAVAEINTCSDICVSYELVKDSRKVVAIRFEYAFKDCANTKTYIKETITNLKRLLS